MPGAARRTIKQAQLFVSVHKEKKTKKQGSMGLKNNNQKPERKKGIGSKNLLSYISPQTFPCVIPLFLFFKRNREVTEAPLWSLAEI